MGEHRRAAPLLKVCGMREPSNCIELLQKGAPDYIGLIFAPHSPRNLSAEHIQALQPLFATSHTLSTRFVGVFVNPSLEAITEVLRRVPLQALQLHGDEGVAFCEACKKQFPALSLWKAHGIKDTLMHDELHAYASVVDHFLFDTKITTSDGKTKSGGTGTQFDWKILEHYRESVPYFISGGIGAHDVEAIRTHYKKDPRCSGVDINSRFESAPGVKNIEQILGFKNALGQL